MDVTIIGTGNMARAIGSRVHAGGHDLTVVGKDAESAEEVASELQAAPSDGSVATAVAGDDLGGDVVVLAV
jgi:prephenate dehydrogenase